MVKYQGMQYDFMACDKEKGEVRALNMDWGLAGAVILSGLAIVFVILIILIWCVMLTGRISGGLLKKPDKPAVQAAESAVSIQSEIESETVAVISAAVYSCLETEEPGTGYVIKSINRVRDSRPVWGFAGMQQNTRPF